MVAAKFVGSGYGLNKLMFWSSCRVNFYRRATRRRDDLSRCYGEGEDVGDVSCLKLVFSDDGGAGM